MEQLSQAETFYGYHNIPRPGAKRLRSLSNSCSRPMEFVLIGNTDSFETI